MAAPKKPIELRFALFSPPRSDMVANCFAPWSKKVEEATKGRVKITLYAGGTIAKMREMLEATATGLADIGIVMTGVFPGRFPLTKVTTLPFVNLESGTVNGRTLAAGVNSSIIQKLYETFPEIQAEWAEVKVLFLFTTSPNDLFTIDKPVRNMADLKGMKIRCLAGPPLVMFKLLGATPVTIPMPGLYGALEKGVIEGGEMAWAPVADYRLYEVVRYATDVNFTLTTFSIVMNKGKWNSLPPDIQKAIMSVSGIYGAEFAGEAVFGLRRIKQPVDMIKEAGYEIQEISLEPGELEKWIETGGKPVRDKWVADMEAKGLPGKKVLDEALRLIKKYKP